MWQTYVGNNYDRTNSNRDKMPRDDKLFISTKILKPFCQFDYDEKYS